MLVVKYSESIELKKKKKREKDKKDLNTLKISCFVKNAFFFLINQHIILILSLCVPYLIT